MITISFCLFYFFMFQTSGLLVTQRFMLIPILGIISNQVYITVNGVSPYPLSKSTALCKLSSNALPWRASQTISQPRMITVPSSLHSCFFPTWQWSHICMHWNYYYKNVIFLKTIYNNVQLFCLAYVLNASPHCHLPDYFLHESRDHQLLCSPLWDPYPDWVPVT